MEDLGSGVIKLDFDNDFYWNVIVNISKIEKHKKEKEPIIELSWGWTVGMSKEEIKEYESAEDNPTGHKSLYITLSQAKELKNNLDKIIKILKTK